MAVEIRVPPLGESLVDAVVGAWLKQEGDAVARGDSLVELETDKVNLDVTAEEDGVLARIDRREGDVVTVGEVLGLVGASNGASAPAPAAPIAQPVSAAVPERVEAPVPTPAALIALLRLRRFRNRNRRRLPSQTTAISRAVVGPRRRYGDLLKSTTSI